MTDIDGTSLAARARDALATVFRSVGLEAAEQNSSIVVLGKRVSVAPRITNEAHRAGRSMVAVEFEVAVDGASSRSLLAGVVGVDAHAEGARGNAVTDWIALYGGPIGLTLAQRFGATGRPAPTHSSGLFYAKVDVDGFRLFRSPPGLRGAAKASSEELALLVQSLAVLTAPVLRRTPHLDGYASASILVEVAGTSVIGGECRIDGVVSPELLQTISQASWPAAVTSYMFKLFFAAVAPHA